MKKRLFNRVEYYNDKDELHRTDGPAIEYDSGSKYWYVNGIPHREDDLPAKERYNGDKYWYLNGKMHRENGPAIILCDGYKQWYLNGVNYKEEEYQEELIKLKLKRLVNL